VTHDPAGHRSLGNHTVAGWLGASVGMEVIPLPPSFEVDWHWNSVNYVIRTRTPRLPPGSSSDRAAARASSMPDRDPATVAEDEAYARHIDAVRRIPPVAFLQPAMIELLVHRIPPVAFLQPAMIALLVHRIPPVAFLQPAMIDLLASYGFAPVRPPVLATTATPPSPRLPVVAVDGRGDEDDVLPTFSGLSVAHGDA